MVSNIMFKIVNLEIDSPWSMPKSSKRKLGEHLRKYGYDESFVDDLNADRVIGYDVAVRVVKRFASRLLDAAYQDDEKACGTLTKTHELLCAVMSRIEGFDVAGEALKNLLREYEQDDDFIEGINADIEAGFKLGIEVLTKSFTTYREKLEFRMQERTQTAKQLLADGFNIPADVGFEFAGQWIRNPFYDETLRFELDDPCTYYGAENVELIVDWILENAPLRLNHLDSANMKYESCAFSCKRGLAGGCTLDGYPILDCPNCKSYKHKEEM